MAFYRQVADDRFEATPYTRGPWDAGAQHAGPPAALLGRAVELVPQRSAMRVARLTFDIIRPVPIGTLTVTARLVRTGRSVAAVEAELAPDDGPIAMRATALLIRVAEEAAPAVPGADPPGQPDSASPVPFYPVPYDVGYHTAMEYRFTAGSFVAPGPAICWMRMRVPLVEGEEPSPLARVLCAADSGNGISSVLDFRRFVFVNSDLTINLLRRPQGEWTCIDAQTLVGPQGNGLAEARIFDASGLVGRSTQSLPIRARD